MSEISLKCLEIRETKKSLEISEISKHLKGQLGPRVSHVFRTTKGFCHFPVSRHFSFSVTPSKNFVIFLFLDTFRNQGIL